MSGTARLAPAQIIASRISSCLAIVMRRRSLGLNEFLMIAAAITVFKRRKRPFRAIVLWARPPRSEMVAAGLRLALNQRSTDGLNVKQKCFILERG